MNKYSNSCSENRVLLKKYWENKNNIGRIVGKYFPCHNMMMDGVRLCKKQNKWKLVKKYERLYLGRVLFFKDNLYRVKFFDGEFEDWYEYELTKGIKIEPASTLEKYWEDLNHIGRIVGKIKPSHLTNGRLSFGHVSLAGKNLYRIEFDDGDTEDWDETELGLGIRIFSNRM
jgi:uncharacterized protein YqgQ